MSKQVNTSYGPLALSLAELPEIVERLDKGQKFTLFEIAGKEYRGWRIAVGPISDHLTIASYIHHEIANLIVDALRHATGQEPLLCRAFDGSKDSDND